ncbi:Putative CRISPR-associated endonuclease Cmr2 [Desulfonema limicola]|uniref:CRISPR-associated endonuclease Cmr2 n=1 Tax=Desulfonema limicola TaxID=45656 RepID=A0A975GGG7_9BACT|nr:type III-B CRISPR-associated protein Cas10/Cmr2 [Desulfonema limicola]QTA80247.1 Putative CRISPR-associated endonuclease Cmr2 [Desulfonema limicola]
MEKYLIQATIGPVQDFIASARKLRDLWFGSYFLSELSKTIARSFKEQGANLIFPSIASSDDLAKDSSLIVANKIFAELETENSPAYVIEKAKIAWVLHRKEFAAKTLEKIKKIKKIKINQDLFNKQIEDSGEFFGAWVKLTDDYKSSKVKLEKLLAGRKNTREFYAPAWDGTGIPKNSLDGIREAVTGDNQEEIIGLIKKNEKLDTLGLIKRCYPLTRPNKKLFDDLSKVAIQPWLKGVSLNHYDILVKKFISNFIEEPLDQDKINQINPVDYADKFYLENKELIKVKNAYSDYKTLSKIIGIPNKYACIIVGDGDNMGKTLDMIISSEGHQTFTRLLGMFAQDIEKTISDLDGSLIYAGGDDVMAYVPLDSMIECADIVRKKFAETMKKIFDELSLTGKQPTFSIGAAIVHHSMPLDQALNTARKAEQTAKKYVSSKKEKKNALAVIQKKRGGSELVVCDNWEKSQDEKAGIINRFTTMCSLYKNEKLPSTLAYQLRQASISSGDKLKFEYSDKDKRIVPLNAASVSVLRIFDQKEHSEILKNLLLNQESIRKLSDELVIANQISYAQKLSRGDFSNEI